MDESDKDDPCDDVSGKNALEGWIKASENPKTPKPLLQEITSIYWPGKIFQSIQIWTQRIQWYENEI